MFKKSSTITQTSLSSNFFLLKQSINIQSQKIKAKMLSKPNINQTLMSGNHKGIFTPSVLKQF